jgi:hypothetical protein
MKGRNFFNTSQKGREKKRVNFMDQKKKGDEGKNDSSTQVKEGERRK